MKTHTLKTALSILFLVFFAVGGIKASNTHVKSVPNANITFATLEISNSIEEEIYIEEWMTDDEIWNTPTTKGFEMPEEEIEMELEIEDWMTNDKMFNFNREKHVNLEEGSMQIEAWMTNSQIWKLKN